MSEYECIRSEDRSQTQWEAVQEGPHCIHQSFAHFGSHLIMATIVHKLSTLHSLGQSLLVQLYNVRTFLSDPRVRPEFAAPQHVKLAKSLTSRFPEIPPYDKVRQFKYPISAECTPNRLATCVCVLHRSIWLFLGIARLLRFYYVSQKFLTNIAHCYVYTFDRFFPPAIG